LIEDGNVYCSDSSDGRKIMKDCVFGVGDTIGCSILDGAERGWVHFTKNKSIVHKVLFDEEDVFPTIAANVDCKVQVTFKRKNDKKGV
jgi:hypothetical protein